MDGFDIFIIGVVMFSVFFLTMAYYESEKQNQEVQKELESYKTCSDLGDGIMKAYLDGYETKPKIFLKEFKDQGCKFDLTNPIMEKLD